MSKKASFVFISAVFAAVVLSLAFSGHFASAVDM